jgi:DNA-binding PadR family transcriptional regulator
MPKENTTRYILLGLLSHEVLSGYEMKKRMDIAISHFWPVGFGQIYPTLALLETEGCVEKSVSDTSQGPEKHLYSITPKGRESLSRWLAQPADSEYAKYEILLKLFFAAQGNVDDNVARIDAFLVRHEENLHMMQSFRAELERMLDGENDHLYFYLTVLFGEKVYEAYTNWALEAKTLLSAHFAKEKELGK